MSRRHRRPSVLDPSEHPSTCGCNCCGGAGSMPMFGRPYRSPRWCGMRVREAARFVHFVVVNVHALRMELQSLCNV